ncbi:hypothetical protein BC351_00995 [Paenibacillus ferrarius]|uniref:Uncharacterized protein n=1 Tax=Paenibacillus ferrarius TaxID=1469647 RepID=A0A1V4HSB9_9BACL|nr:hypothetical protein BC351_00995 [Paenibacillus ferrarius]
MDFIKKKEGCYKNSPMITAITVGLTLNWNLKAPVDFFSNNISISITSFHSNNRNYSLYRCGGMRYKILNQLKQQFYKERNERD